MAYWQYPRYVSVAEKRAKAERKKKQLLKKNPKLRPVVIEGHALATTWWGKSWNQNLERYADYENRIGRGRSYVRHGAVLDLQISPGVVTAIVQGSRSTPYQIEIKIKPISPRIWREMKTACAGKFDSLKSLMAGKFPKTLEALFLQKGQGLFPTPDEISFSCSCPDWASMCKHVAATLYAVGARLDEDPQLFFRLRNVAVGDLISETIAESTQELLRRAEKKTGRRIADADLSDVFGIDLDSSEHTVSRKAEVKSSPAKLKVPVSAPEKKKPAKPSVRKLVKEPAAKKEKVEKIKKQGIDAKKPVISKEEKPAVTDWNLLFDMIRKSRKGFSTADLIKKSGFDEKKVRNLVFKLKTMGKIKSLSRGIYVKA